MLVDHALPELLPGLLESPDHAAACIGRVWPRSHTQSHIAAYWMKLHQTLRMPTLRPLLNPPSGPPSGQNPVESGLSAFCRHGTCAGAVVAVWCDPGRGGTLFRLTARFFL
jgi:hypothetical protein